MANRQAINERRRLPWIKRYTQPGAEGPSRLDGLRGGEKNHFLDGNGHVFVMVEMRDFRYTQ